METYNKSGLRFKQRELTRDTIAIDLKRSNSHPNSSHSKPLSERLKSKPFSPFSSADGIHSRISSSSLQNKSDAGAFQNRFEAKLTPKPKILMTNRAGTEIQNMFDEHSDNFSRVKTLYSMKSIKICKPEESRSVFRLYELRTKAQRTISQLTLAMNEQLHVAPHKLIEIDGIVSRLLHAQKKSLHETPEISI